MVESWTWESEDAVRVLLRPERLREQCSHSHFCNVWVPQPSAGEEDERHETWAVCWLRLVWLTTRQSSFVGACAVVTRSVPPAATVAGNPARLVHARSNA